LSCAATFENLDAMWLCVGSAASTSGLANEPFWCHTIF